MSYQKSVTINAPAERVWSVLTDVERWPESTASMTSVQRLDQGPFQSGSQARIKQPRVPTLVWTVSEMEPLRHFTWYTRSPGVTTWAGHVLTPAADGGTTVTLSIGRTGPLAPLTDLFFGKLTREYVDMEAAGLKRVVEAAQPTTTRVASPASESQSATAPRS